MAKQITHCATQLITFETTLPFAEVCSRLDQELNRSKEGQVLSLLQDSTSKDDIVNKINEISGGNDFLYFSSNSHSQWLNAYFGTNTTPRTHLYTLGSPLIAQTILQHDLRAGLNLPPRLLVTENGDRLVTKIIYFLPSSVLPPDNDNANFRDAAEVLDRKLERFVTKIVTV